MAEEKVDQTEKAAKKGKKKWPIVVGVLAVVIAAAGAGFWVWHGTPGFCSAICHTPMDAYVETYVDGTHDKYGNELTDESAQNAMMARMHGQMGTADCLACHVPTLSEQITEGMHWVTGNYEVLGTTSMGNTILDSKTLTQLTAARGGTADEFCLNESCHNMTRDDLITATADLSDVRNPHVPQHGENDCGVCHKGHAQSVNYCSTCHNDAPIPEGWLTAAEAAQIQVIK